MGASISTVMSSVESIAHKGAKEFMESVVSRYESARDEHPMSRKDKPKKQKRSRSSSQKDPLAHLVQQVVTCINSTPSRRRTWALLLQDVEIPADVFSIFCDVLKGDKLLTELGIFNCRLSKESMECLGPALAANEAMQVLNLSGNSSIGEEGILVLIEFLKENTSLHTLILDSTNAGDKGSIAVAEVLETTRSLKVVGLADNDISQLGYSRLLEAAEHNIFVTDIRLRDNSCIDNVKTKRIGQVFKRNEAVEHAFRKLFDNVFLQLNIQLRASQTNIIRMQPQGSMGMSESPHPETQTREDPRFARGRARGGTMDISLVPTHILNATSDEEPMEDFGNTPCERFDVGSTHTRGRRKEMQDTMLIQGTFRGKPNEHLFCVFDGHGSQESAIYCAKHVCELLCKYLEETKEDYVRSLRETFLHLDKEMESFAVTHGTTAVVVLIVDNEMYVANVGDSRAVLCRDGKALRLTVDHKPCLEGETERVEALGGQIRNDRVQGALAVTRALGDAQFGNLVSPDPYISRVYLNRQDEFLLVACDGLYDIFMDDVAIEIGRGFKEALPAATRLKDQAFISGSTDNISVIVIRFRDSFGAVEPSESHELFVCRTGCEDITPKLSGAKGEAEAEVDEDDVFQLDPDSGSGQKETTKGDTDNRLSSDESEEDDCYDESQDDGTEEDR